MIQRKTIRQKKRQKKHFIHEIENQLLLSISLIMKQRSRYERTIEREQHNQIERESQREREREDHAADEKYISFVAEHFFGNEKWKERKKEGQNLSESNKEQQKERQKIMLPINNPFHLLMSISSMMMQRMRERETGLIKVSNKYQQKERIVSLMKNPFHLLLSISSMM